MGFVNLVSGGLDSTLIGVMAREDGLEQYPLFVDYGQRAAVREWETCQDVHRSLQLPSPTRMDLSGFGKVILSGLTDKQKDVKLDAFTPGRNLMFLIMGGAFAHQTGATSIAIGLLSEEFSLFPDQTASFISHAEAAINSSLDLKLKIVTPLSAFSKADVIRLAKSKGIAGTYSCHIGDSEPCGYCISCLEFNSQRER